MKTENRLEGFPAPDFIRLFIRLQKTGTSTRREQSKIGEHPDHIDISGLKVESFSINPVDFFLSGSVSFSYQGEQEFLVVPISCILNLFGQANSVHLAELFIDLLYIDIGSGDDYSSHCLLRTFVCIRS